MEKLYTVEGEKLSGIPWQVYPRPQMVREGWQNLNGEWLIGKTAEQTDRRILVPFCPESLLSGIGEEISADGHFCYRKNFRLELPKEGRRILLHFGAVDQLCKVWLNGTPIGEHVGGYLHFSFDVTKAIREENELLVEVTDELNHDYPWGKQKKDRGGMWYTPVSGIWQTVWLESVPLKYVKKLRIRTGMDFAELEIKGAEQGELRIETPEGIRTESFSDGKLRLDFKEPRLWSPEDPYLYYFTLTAGEDCVRSYLALRSITAEEGGKHRLLLNGKPYFFHGLLDQGYFSDGIYTPAVPEAYEKDILAMKSLGFNTLRKHIKLEPEQFYYDCDRLGMVVFQDMVNNSEYSFFRDGVMPNLGIWFLPDKQLSRDPERRRIFMDQMKKTVDQLYSHPSILYWTIFNEGWGQFRASWAYGHLKRLDPDRILDSTSGWHRASRSDVVSRHIYFRRLKMKPEDRPTVLSEFGGFTFKLEGHSSIPDKTYGYGSCETQEEFRDRVRAVYLTELLPLAESFVSGAIYTQVSDVEEETNGFFTYDRRVLKLKPEDMLDIAEKLQEAVRK